MLLPTCQTRTRRTLFVLTDQEKQKVWSIYGPYGRELTRIANTILRSVGRDEGDDAAHDAFIAFAYEAAHGRLLCLDSRRIADIPDAELADYAEDCYSFLKYIVVQKCREYCRRLRLRPKVGIHELLVAAENCDPKKRLDDEEVTRRLDRAMAALSPRLREVAALRHVHSRSEKEIAAILGIPLGTVKSRLYRGYCKMAILLDGKCGDRLFVSSGRDYKTADQADNNHSRTKKHIG